MEGARLSRNELNNLIVYALEKNNVDTTNLDMREINRIIMDYMSYCDFFKRNYVIGELDSFKRASCLVVAINNSRIVNDARVKASIALDAAYKWIETPVWNIGPNHDKPEAMETVNFEDVFSDDMDSFNKSKGMLMDSLVYEQGLPINYNLSCNLDESSIKIGETVTISGILSINYTIV